MATPHLLLDIFDPEVWAIRDRTESVIYGHKGGLATDPEIQRRYLSGFRRPYISALIDDVLKDHRWHLGKTMTEVAEQIGTDHTTVSRALRWGILPNELETYLLACPSKPDDWQKPIQLVYAARHRAGSMAAAEYLWTKRPGSRWPLARPLSELNAEFIFTLWDQRMLWKHAHHLRDEELARRIVDGVVEDPAREAVPFWYDKKRRRETSGLIQRLRSDGRFALKWLSLLQTRWQDDFVTAESAVEGLGWLKRLRKLPVSPDAG